MQQHLTQQPGQEQKAYPQGSATSGDAGLAKALSPAQEELPVMIKHGPMHGLLNAHQFCCPAEAFGSVACSEGTSSSPTLSIDSVIHTDDERRDVALLAVTESSSPLFTFSPTPAPTEPVAMATPPLPEDSVGSEWGELQRVADVRSSGEMDSVAGLTNNFEYRMRACVGACMGTWWVHLRMMHQWKCVFEAWPGCGAWAKSTTLL